MIILLLLFFIYFSVDEASAFNERWHTALITPEKEDSIVTLGGLVTVNHDFLYISIYGDKNLNQDVLWAGEFFGLEYNEEFLLLAARPKSGGFHKKSLLSTEEVLKRLRKSPPVGMIVPEAVQIYKYDDEDFLLQSLDFHWMEDASDARHKIPNILGMAGEMIGYHTVFKKSVMEKGHLDKLLEFLRCCVYDIKDSQRPYLLEISSLVAILRRFGEASVMEDIDAATEAIRVFTSVHENITEPKFMETLGNVKILRPAVPY